MTAMKKIVAGATLLCAFAQIATASHPGHHAPMRRRHVHHMKRGSTAPSPAADAAANAVNSAANTAYTANPAAVPAKQDKDTYGSSDPSTDDKEEDKGKYNDREKDKNDKKNKHDNDNRSKSGRGGKSHSDHGESRGGGGGDDGECAFPEDAGLVYVPGAMNKGWAMSPDQPCKPGNYCPYACPQGQVSMQWDPNSKYTYPASMNGGLYCEKDGKMSKPRPDQPYCVDGVSSVLAVADCDQDVAICQTVLPGNEAMLIPSVATAKGTNIAVPDQTYWEGTAAHFYINPPGVSVEEACIWGTNQRNVGNWSPYVAGANTDCNGNTFVKIGWNPIYLEPTTPFRNERPDFGIKIECVKGECNGLPCEINPAKHDVNEISCKDKQDLGAGGAAFCVATVSKGGQARIVITNGKSRAPAPAKAKASPPQPAYEEEAPPAPAPPSESAPLETADDYSSKPSSKSAVEYPVESYTPPKSTASDVSKYPVLVNNQTSSESTVSSASANSQTPAPPAPPAESNFTSSASRIPITQLPMIWYGVLLLLSAIFI